MKIRFEGCDHPVTLVAVVNNRVIAQIDPDEVVDIDIDSLDAISIQLAPYFKKVREMSLETRQKIGLITSKPVIQYDLKGNEIARFVSQNAAAKATGLLQTSISKCCRGVITHTGLSAFKFAPKQKQTRTRNLQDGRNGSWLRKVVVQRTLTGEEVARFVSQTEAAKKTGILRVNICAAVNGRLPDAGGFKWTNA